jgi:presqualene diphosphate synthase
MTAAQSDVSEYRARISGSSFYTAMRLMPKVEREAMFAVYMFCRLVDDIADDGTRPRPARAAALAEWRKDIDALYGGRPAGQASFLQGPVQAFGLRQADFLAVIDGMEMDVVTDVRAPDLATLGLYCDRVAVAVGRLSTRVFGMEEAPGSELAHQLGRALQLTNILRDLDEDAGIGRLYLPREALDQAGITTSDPSTALRSPNLSQACAPLVERARTHFVEADRIMKRCPRRTVKAPRIMGEVYRGILEGMIARGWSAPRQRVSVSRARLLRIILRYAFI